MSQSSDVDNLFRRFGGNAADYQEVGREDGAELARRRWPLLGSMTQTARGAIPPLDRQPVMPASTKVAAPVAATATAAPAPDDASEAAAPTVAAAPGERSALAALFGTSSASNEQPTPSNGQSPNLSDLFRRLAAIPNGSDTDSSPLRQLASAKRKLP